MIIVVIEDLLLIPSLYAGKLSKVDVCDLDVDQLVKMRMLISDVLGVRVFEKAKLVCFLSISYRCFVKGETWLLRIRRIRV